MEGHFNRNHLVLIRFDIESKKLGTNEIDELICVDEETLGNGANGRSSLCGHSESSRNLCAQMSQPEPHPSRSSP